MKWQRKSFNYTKLLKEEVKKEREEKRRQSALMARIFKNEQKCNERNTNT